MTASTEAPRLSNRLVAAGALCGAMIALSLLTERYSTVFSVKQLVVLTVVAAAGVVVAARWQAAALGLMWLLLALHVTTTTLFLPAELAIAFVAFACAAWGSRWVLAASLVSIPVAAVACAGVVVYTWDNDPDLVATWLMDFGLLNVATTAQDSGPGATIVAGLLGLFSLTVPWLAGLAVRLARRSDASLATAQRAESERDTAQAARTEAEEVAHVREAQAQLARDVHDVVGHSLTVILAQAEAAQFQSDPEAVKRTLATITDTARASLEDVRQVLHSTGSHPVVGAEQDLQDLLEGIRASGREVHLHDVGEPRPLPPDRAPVAHRVLQEMLTNAIRHGAHGAIHVERHWAGDLRLEVTNPVVPVAAATAESAAADPALTQPIALDPAAHRTGSGIEGMRRRLEAVGGRLDVRQRSTPPTFTATAWIPLPGRFEESR